ncbi:MAG: DUF4198 domain-containing protein [Chitinophagales bacterium]|nr:DUF4198 domain-containing protein [Chitinophagales bacterium]
MNFKISAFFICFLLCSIFIYSHDYVLTPEKFNYEKGETMLVHLMVGEIYNYEFERELQLNMTPRFQLYTQKKVTSLLVNATDSMIPVAEHTVDFEGLGMLVMERNPSMIEEKPGAFENYLGEERVNGIIFDSTAWKKKVVKERYTRYLKSLVLSGTSDKEDFYMQPVGLKLEIILLVNPFVLKPEEEVVVQVLLDGKPFANSLLGITQQTYKSAPFTDYAFTDKKGI